jgi:hypothetical protein
MLKKTFTNLFLRFKNEVLDYELHVPMIMEKEKLLKVLEVPDLWRSRYGNTYGVGGIEIDDVKVYGKGSLVKKSYDINVLKYDYLSSNDDSFAIVKEKVLDVNFPKATVYEA